MDDSSEIIIMFKNPISSSTISAKSVKYKSKHEILTILEEEYDTLYDEWADSDYSYEAFNWWVKIYRRCLSKGIHLAYVNTISLNTKIR